MQTPIISKKQQKATLSGRKSKKETIKNVVAKPYANYWPLLTPPDNEKLCKTLRQHLPRLQNAKISLPYEKIKSVPKDERKQFRKQLLNQAEIHHNPGERECIVMGVNSVAQALENETICSILVSADVQPRLFVQHIVDQSVLFKIPILVVTNLRDELKSATGIAASCFGLIHKAKLCPGLQLIEGAICKTFERYPVPPTHVNFKRSLVLSRNLHDLSIVEVSDSDMSSVLLIEDETSEDSQEKSEKYEYLHREAANKRVFDPPVSQPDKKKHEMQPDSTGFIAFSGENEAGSAQTQKISSYRSLQVKRLQSNKNRDRKKLANIKKRRKM